MNTEQPKIKPIHFPPEPNWEDAKAKALASFYSHKQPCRLVCSVHWASEGFWLEFPPYTPLALEDNVTIFKK